MPTDLERIAALPAAGIGRWPTPLERREVARRPVWIKRDDLSHHGRGGVKARKIDLVLGGMLAGGHRELISTATNVTNLVHDLAPVLRDRALGLRMYITDDPPIEPVRRRALFAGVEDSIELLGRERGRVAVRIAAAATAGHARGRRPLVVMPSLGHPFAVAGVARGYLEAMAQLRAQSDEPPRTLFITAASGTTLAGLLLGEHLARAAGAPPVQIVGAAVYEGPIAAYVRLLLRLTRRRLGLRAAVGDIRPVLDTRALGGGYARWSGELAALCDRVRDEHGLTIDPIYGAKTWSILEAAARGESPGFAPPWLYWHCGFTPHWRELPC